MATGKRSGRPLIGDIRKNHLYIEEWMKHRALDDKQMAKRIGVKRETFNRYRNHQSRINTEVIGAIATALELEPVDLYCPPGTINLPVPEELRETALDMLSILAKRSTG